MAKLREEAVRHDIRRLLPEQEGMEPGKVKVRICDLDRLTSYVMNAYALGYDLGKKSAKKSLRNYINKV